jgi:hypothetical protein
VGPLCKEVHGMDVIPSRLSRGADHDARGSQDGRQCRSADHIEDEIDC